MAEVILFIKFFVESKSVIKSIFSIWKKTPAEKRNQLLSEIHSAINKGGETGDTSDEENLIRNGLS